MALKGLLALKEEKKRLERLRADREQRMKLNKELAPLRHPNFFKAKAAVGQTISNVGHNLDKHEWNPDKAVNSDRFRLRKKGSGKGRYDLFQI